MKRRGNQGASEMELRQMRMTAQQEALNFGLALLKSFQTDERNTSASIDCIRSALRDYQEASL